MGNRSMTYFYDELGFSPGVYTQWNGGRIFNYLKKANLRAASARGSCARFVAQCCKEMPGNLSVYIYNQPSEEEAQAMTILMKNPSDRKSLKSVDDSSVGDNGTYIVDVRNLNKEGIKVWQVSRYFENRKTKQDFITIGCKQAPDHYDSPQCRYLGSFPALKDMYGNEAKQTPRTQVESSTITSFMVPRKGILLIEFKNGTVYKYFNVDQHAVEQLKHAESKGQSFNTWIKNDFEFKKLEYIPKALSR